MSREIDVTPTWTAVLPILIAALQDGTEEGQKIAKEELVRMAKAADTYNSAQGRVTQRGEALEKIQQYTQQAYAYLNREELSAELKGPNGGYIYSAAERIEWAKNAAREALLG